MIYCANCKKPSAKESGACPHCGMDLCGKAPAAAEEKTPIMGTGEDLDLGDSDISGIELADDDYVPPIEGQITGGPSSSDRPRESAPSDSSSVELASVSVPPPAKTDVPRMPESHKTEDISSDELSRTAAFGPPGDGPIGAVKYWLKVRGRLRALAGEEEIARRSFRKEEARYLASLSELGKLAKETGAAPDAMRPFIDRAVCAEGGLVGVRERSEKLMAEHEEGVRNIERSMEALEAEAAPEREKVAASRAKLDGLKTEHKRIEAKLKRAEIERRNLLGMISSRQESYGDLEKPEEERAKLLSEITKLDEQQPEIVARIKLHRAELDATETPIEEAERVLAKDTERLTEITTKLSALRSERDGLESSFADAAKGVGQQMEGELDLSQRAWAKVGEMACDDPALADVLGESVKDATSVRAAFNGASRRVDLLVRAAGSYDHGTFDKGKKVVFAAGGVLGALIVILIVVAAV